MPPAIVVLTPRRPNRMATWPAAQFITVFGNSIGLTRYGLSCTSVSRV